jgi:hypothetical protein
MITTIQQVNEKLSIMDSSISTTLETKDIKSLTPFFEVRYELHTAIYGRTWGVSKPIKPSFCGHLIVKPEFVYLLDCLKPL